jgi:hypothetical protein
MRRRGTTTALALLGACVACLQTVGGCEALLDAGALTERGNGDAGVDSTVTSDASGSSSGSESGSGSGSGSSSGSDSGSGSSSGADSASDAGGGSDAGTDGATVTYNDFTLAQNWSVGELLVGDAGCNSWPYGAGAFDGRYVYLACSNHVEQYDTQGALDASASWSAHNFNTSISFSCGAFAGHEVYFGAVHARGWVESYDNGSILNGTNSWAQGSPPDAGLAYEIGRIVNDGRYLYLLPTYENGGVSGLLAQYDTTGGDLRDAAAWSLLNVGAAIDAGPGFMGYYQGGAFDGQYVYLAPGAAYNPGQPSYAVQYDTTKSLTSSGAWVGFDVTSVSPLSILFGAAVFDGQYVYFAPSGSANGTNAMALRFDTHGSFAQKGSWKAFDVSGVDKNALAFSGATFDGRYVYFVPRVSTVALRYDTKAQFDLAQSWSKFDLSTLGLSPNDVSGALFDGEYVYMIPGVGGVLVRFDAKKPPSLPPFWSNAFN